MPKLGQQEGHFVRSIVPSVNRRTGEASDRMKCVESATNRNKAGLLSAIGE
jgi:hypothetical protein